MFGGKAGNCRITFCNTALWVLRLYGIEFSDHKYIINFCMGFRLSRDKTKTREVGLVCNTGLWVPTTVVRNFIRNTNV